MAIVRTARLFARQGAYQPHSAAPLAELVDARDSKSRSFGSAGSIPAGGTNKNFKTLFLLIYLFSRKFGPPFRPLQNLH